MVRRNTNTDEDYEPETGMDIETVGIDSDTRREADAETSTEVNEVLNQQTTPEYRY
jgi:hypothetical protein